MRPNFDGTKAEPVVLPARIPNLLVNGATGIAVGMATNIPPHNLGEVCTALVKLLDNEELTTRAAVPLDQGAGLPHRRRHPQHARRAEGDLPDGQRRGEAAGDVGGGPGRARLEDRLRHEHPLRDRQERPRRAHRRHRPRPQAAAAARRARRLDRRRPHRARAEEGRRREDGAGVPVQAHAAADQLQRQPHLPDPDRAGGGRPAGAPRPEGDALALPALPPRGGDRAARARAGLAVTPPAPPRRLREDLRRPRRDPADRAQVGGQGRRGAADHRPLRARRRADRRDPRAEDLPPGAARDPGDPGGARRGAEAGPRAARRPRRRGGALGHGARGDRGGPHRRSVDREGRAAHHLRRRGSGGRVLGRGLHRRRGRHRAAVARRLDQAPEGRQGSGDDAAP